jgi:aryl-alcohol dehydrogenase-like predicted oxidoreductase
MEVILGTVQFGLAYGINNTSGKPEAEKVYEILEYAHASGISRLDTAEDYGNAQELIGSFMQSTGKYFEINSKFRIKQGRSIAETLNETLRQLHISHVSSYFYHAFDDLFNFPGSIRELCSLRDEEKIHQIGVSVYDNNQLRKAIAQPEIDVIQLPFNLLDNYAQRGSLLREAKQQHKKIQVRSVFLQGLFFKNVETFPTQLDPLKKYILQLQSLGTAHQLDMEKMALQYISSQEDIDSMLIGIDTVDQLKKNLDDLNEMIPGQLKEQIDRIHVTESELLYPLNWK